ncbi:hypothetical protein [Streptomyces formicae]
MPRTEGETRCATPPDTLGVVLALGRYEELLLPPARNPDETDGARRHARHAA